MATQQDLELTINTKVEAGNSAASIGDLRRQIKELNSLALQFGDEFPEAAKRASAEAAKLSDRLDDTKEALQDLKGEPIERIQSSVSRLREGFTTLDLPKITSSFKNLGAAVFSVGGIFAVLLSAIMFIVENFETLKNSGGAVGAIFTAIGKAIEFVKDLFLDLADTLGLVDKEMVKNALNNKNAADATKDNTKEVKLYNDEEERRLKLLGLAGKSEREILLVERNILKQRLDANIKTNTEIKKQSAERLREDMKNLKTTQEELFKGNRNIFEGQSNFIQDLNKVNKKVENPVIKNPISEKEIEAARKRLEEIEIILERIDKSKKEVVKVKTEEVKKEVELKKIRERTQEDIDNEYNKLNRKKDLESERAKKIEQFNKNLKTATSEINEEERKRLEQQEYELDLIKKREEGYKNLGSTFDNLASKFNSGGSMVAASIAKSFGGVRQSFSKVIDDYKKGSDEFAKSALTAASSLTAGIGDLLSANITQQINDSKRQTDERINDLNRQLNETQTSLDKQLAAGLISEDEYNRNKTLFQEDFNNKKYELELDQFNKETDLKKQAFEQTKAIQIVQAIILSTQAALAAYLSGMQAGGPFGPAVGGIFAGIAAAFGAVQVALIASQTFPGNGAGPTRATSPTAPSGGSISGSTPNPLAIQDIGGSLTQRNQQEEMRVYVLEKDITASQGRTAQIKDRSRR